ncbi:MAG TPA: hypothetical protein VLL52_09345 [Anaerolineae bacterium]|nr:hypothetical protein [Anaerolineae bacterium]
MAEKDQNLWDIITEESNRQLLQAAFDHAARGLSFLIGHPLHSHEVGVRQASIQELTELVGSPEDEFVGIYLLIKGNSLQQAILMMPVVDGLRMAEQLLGEPDNSIQELGELELSALAEVGNVVLTSCLNKLAQATGVATLPSPPAVVVDMLATLLSVTAASAAVSGDNFYLLDSAFYDEYDTLKLRMWILPDVDLQVALLKQ